MNFFKNIFEKCYNILFKSKTNNLLSRTNKKNCYINEDKNNESYSSNNESYISNNEIYSSNIDQNNISNNEIHNNIDLIVNKNEIKIKHNKSKILNNEINNEISKNINLNDKNDDDYKNNDYKNNDYNDYQIFKKYLKKDHLKQNNNFSNNKYFVKSNYKIGCGGYGNVYKIYCSNKNKYALKISYDKNYFINEVNILKKLNNYHKNIIIFYDYFDNLKNKIYILDFIKDFNFNYFNCIVFELSYKNTLFDFIEFKLNNKYFDSLSVKNIFSQIASAIKYAHSLNIAHLDLKLENILLYNYDEYKYHVKIIDWGFSYDYSKNNLINFNRGTKSYIAPEVLFKFYYKPNLVDMWSMGVCIFSCLYGFYPFEIATNDDYRFNKINYLQNLGKFDTVKEILNFYNNIKYPLIDKDLEYILNNLLIINPEKRLKINDLYMILKKN